MSDSTKSIAAPVPTQSKLAGDRNDMSMNFSSRLLLFVTLTMGLALHGTAHAQEDVPAIRGVVELFTSQGCNACPPADEVLSQLSRDDSLIAIGYHVDYWNYRGWKDTFSSKENTALQTGYMKSFKNRAMFTPQAVINGQIGVNGADMMAIRSQLVTTSAPVLTSTLPVTLKVEARENVISLLPTLEDENIPARTHIVAIQVEPERKVLIESGENKGRMITYSNIVLQRKIMDAPLRNGAALEMPISEFSSGKDDNSYWIFLIQQMDEAGLPGKIMGANRMKL